MTVQETVTARPIVIRAGQEYDTATTKDVVSGVAAEAIAFGLYVIQKDEGWELPTSDADIKAFVGGVALIDNNLPTEQGYLAGDSIRVMVTGRVGVDTAGGMVRGGVVYVRHTTGTSTVLGQFAGVVDSTFQSVMTGFRVYQSTPGSDTPTVIELNAPGATA